MITPDVTSLIPSRPRFLLRDPSIIGCGQGTTDLGLHTGSAHHRVCLIRGRTGLRSGTSTHFTSSFTVLLGSYLLWKKGSETSGWVCKCPIGPAYPFLQVMVIKISDPKPREMRTARSLGKRYIAQRCVALSPSSAPYFHRPRFPLSRTSLRPAAQCGQTGWLGC